MSRQLKRGEACFECRQHKTKCDSIKPCCTPCKSYKRQCVYKPPKTLVQKLEEKIKDLEAKIHSASLSSSESGATANLIRADTPVRAIVSSNTSILHPSPSVDFTLQVHNAPRMPQTAQTASIIGLSAGDWDDDVGVDVGNALLEIFVRNRAQFNTDIYLPRLKERMSYPRSHPDSVHPCLRNSIYLAAYSCCGPELKPHEKPFLDRARAEMRRSLEFADRLEDYLWSSIIIAWYLVRNARLLEASNLSTTVVQFAFACNLHEISDPVEYQKSSEGLLDPPKDVFHVSERINLWWSVYLLDRRLALAFALPGGIPSDATYIVSTVWPVSYEVVAKFGLVAWQPGSLSELLKHGSSVQIVGDDTLISLRAKSIALLSRATWLAHLSRNRTPDSFRTLYLSVRNALQTVLDTIPEITDPRGLDNDGLDNWVVDGEGGVNPSLVRAHLSTYSAALILHEINADRDEGEYDRRLKAASALANIARQLPYVGVLYSHICLAPSWYCAAEVVVKEIRRISPPTTTDELERLRTARADLRSLADGLASQTGFYPGLIDYIARLDMILSPTASKLPPSPVSENSIEDSPFFASVTI